ncbi:MAG: hypothetical protein JXB47_09340 [Anaerolineae bacterium]|nr:hypothetical protein [Anaerolineae bacterium]
MNILSQPALTLPRAPCGARWPLVVWAGLGMLLAFGLYIGAVKLPFFQDDPVHIRWLAWHPGIFDPWRTAELLPDYRPLGRFIMQVWARLLGWYDPVVLRTHNILLHVANTALVAALTLRLHRGPGRHTAAGLAALLFAALPFAYQAVVWVNVLFYPLVTFLLLMMLWVYSIARARRNKPLLALALALAFLAPFEIEHAVMAFTVIAALEGVWWLAGWQRRPWIVGPAIALAANLLFLVIWIMQPRFSYSFGFPTPDRVLKNALCFLQGLIFPAAPLARLLYDHAVADNLLAVALVGLPALAVLIWGLRRRGVLIWTGLAWFGLLSVPSLLYLDFWYVHASPRLIYQVAPGAVMLWGAALAALWANTPRAWLTWIRRALVAGLLAGGVIVGGGFARDHVRLYTMSATPIADADRAAAATPDDAPMLLVNMPAWISPVRTAYALGTFGAPTFPYWIAADDLIFAQRGEEQAVQAVSFANVKPVMPYYYDTAGDLMDWETLRQAMRDARGGVYLTHYRADAVDLRYAGRVNPSPSPTGSLLAGFADSVTLLAAEVDADAGGLAVRLVWRIDGAQTANDTVFVHLVGPDGAPVSQADGYPLQGLSPFWLWEPGVVLEDVRAIPWPDGEAAAGDYQVWVGVYDAGSGAKRPAFDPGSGALPGDRLLVWAGARPAS